MEVSVRQRKRLRAMPKAWKDSIVSKLRWRLSLEKFPLKTRYAL